MKNLKNIKMKLKKMLMIVLIVQLTITLSSCCKNKTSNNIPIHRLTKMEIPICKKEKYKDILICLLQYKKALEQSNNDKEIVLNSLLY